MEVRKLVLECEASLVNSTFPDWHWAEQDPETGEPVVTPDPDTGELGPAWREWGTLIPPCGQYQSLIQVWFMLFRYFRRICM